MQPTEPNLTDAERAELDSLNAAGVERWIQNTDNTLEALILATRSRMRQAHKVLDRKVDEEHRVEVANRPADFPKTQTISGAR